MLAAGALAFSAYALCAQSSANAVNHPVRCVEKAQLVSGTSRTIVSKDVHQCGLTHQRLMVKCVSPNHLGGFWIYGLWRDHLGARSSRYCKTVAGGDSVRYEIRRNGVIYREDFAPARATIAVRLDSFTIVASSCSGTEGPFDMKNGYGYAVGLYLKSSPGADWCFLNGADGFYLEDLSTQTCLTNASGPTLNLESCGRFPIAESWIAIDAHQLQNDQSADCLSGNSPSGSLLFEYPCGPSPGKNWNELSS